MLSCEDETPNPDANPDSSDMPMVVEDTSITNNFNIWTGSTNTFIKKDGFNPAVEANQDRLSDLV